MDSSKKDINIHSFCYMWLAVLYSGIALGIVVGTPFLASYYFGPQMMVLFYGTIPLMVLFLVSIPDFADLFSLLYYKYQRRMELFVMITFISVCISFWIAVVISVMIWPDMFKIPSMY